MLKLFRKYPDSSRPAAEPAAEPASAALAGSGQPRAGGEASDADADRVPVGHGPAGVLGSCEPEVEGEVVQGPAGEHRERHPGAQRGRGRRVDRAVAAADAEHLGPGGRRGQFRLQLGALAVDQLRLRKPALEDVEAGEGGGTRTGVDHHGQAVAVRQRGSPRVRPFVTRYDPGLLHVARERRTRNPAATPSAAPAATSDG